MASTSIALHLACQDGMAVAFLRRLRQVIQGAGVGMIVANTFTRRLPIGAEATAEGVAFRIWAPDHRSVEIVFERDSGLPPLELKAETDGYFSGTAGAAAGTLYRIRLDRRGDLLPDPASRFQPLGPEGPSEVRRSGRILLERFSVARRPGCRASALRNARRHLHSGGHLGRCPRRTRGTRGPRYYHDRTHARR